MRIIACLTLLLLIISCNPTEAPKTEVICDEPYIRHGADCCLDANSNRICDEDEKADEPADAAEITEPIVEENQEEIAEPETEPEVLEEPETAPEPPAEPESSWADEYREDIAGKVKMYEFLYDKLETGAMNVLVVGDLIKITQLDSQKWLKYPDQSPEINYIWRMADESTYSACYVSRSAMKEKWCREDNEYIKYADLQERAHPIFPEEWLARYEDKKPNEIREDMTFKDGQYKYSVDELYFENEDGTETVLYVHSSYGVPVRVEVFKNDRIMETYRYADMTINSHSTLWTTDSLEA